MNEMNPAETLERLINVVVDSQKRYEHAAEDVERLELEKFFRRQAADRARFAAELKAQQGHKNGDHQDSGTWSGAVDRAAMDFSVVMSMGDTGVVNWCRQDTEEVIREYDQALASSASPQLRDVLKRQRAEAEKTMAALEDVLREFGGPRS